MKLVWGVKVEKPNKHEVETRIALSCMSHSCASTLSNSIKKKIAHDAKYLGLSDVTNALSLAPAC